MNHTSPSSARRPHPFGRWVERVCRRPGLVTLACLALATGLAWLAATTLTINTSTDDMLSERLPFRAQNEAVDAAFPQLVDTLTLALEGPDALATEAAAERLAEALSTQPDVTQSVFLPEGGAFFRRNGLLYLPRAALKALGDRLAGAQPLLAALQADPSLRGLADLLEQALGPEGEGSGRAGLETLLDQLAAVAEALPEDPQARLSWSALLSEGEETARERRRFLIVKPVIDFNSLQPLEAAVAAIERTAANLGLTEAEGYRLRLTGEPLMLQDELVSVSSGIGVVGLVSAALVGLVLFVGIGSWRLAVAILVTLAAGLASTAGFAALAVGELNIISVAFAVLFIGLSVDFGIHYALRAQESRGSGLNPAAALTDAAHLTGRPLLLCALTSALAFFAFFPTAYRGLSELGLIAGAGMFIALFLNFTLLPALLQLLSVPPHAVRAGPVARAAAGLQRHAGRHARFLAALSLVLTVTAVLALPQARFDDDPLNLRDPDSPSVAALRTLLADPRVSPYSAQLLVDDLAAAEAVASRLEALPEVEAVVSLPSFIPAEQEEKLAVLDDMALFLAPLFIPPPPLPAPDVAARNAALDRLAAALARAPDELQPAASRLLRAITNPEGAAPSQLEHAWLEGFPQALDRLLDGLEAEPVTLNSLPADLVARYRAPDGRVLMEILPVEDLRDRSARERFVDAVQAVAPRASGAAVTIVEAGRAVIDAFAHAMLLALVAIAILLLVVLRSALDTLLVLAPLLLAALLTVAAGVVIDLPFNFANVIALPLLLGLGVDSGIHYVMRARELSAAVMPDARNSTPRAILLSALTTLASFGALSLSQHPGTASMGLLLTVALLLSLVCVLAFLPALLTLTGRLPRL